MGVDVLAVAAQIDGRIQASLTGAPEPPVCVMDILRPYLVIAALAFLLGMSGYGAGAVARGLFSEPTHAVAVETPLYGGKHI